MSYNAKVFNVMIASPIDVASERGMVRDAVYEWNAVHSKIKQIVLLPIGWESHSSPEMGSAPQEIINKQVLDKCDLLVGIFWTRLGTPTQDYSSGTVEEIEKHISSGKPAMLYFSSQPVTPDSVDSIQYAELKKFKNSCKTRGLYQDYDSHSDFKDKFYRHLQIKVNEHEMFSLETVQASLEIYESKTPLPDLSREAKILLKEASLDSDGTVLYLRVIGETEIKANNKSLIQSKDRREIAKWEGALQELLSKGLLESLGAKNQIFEITNLGYQVADMISL